MCPITAAAPQAAARVVSPAQCPSSVATTDLSTSMTSVAPPARRPAMRNMLVAPGFPEPSRIGLWPTMRPIRSADGNVPKKNAPTTKNQTKFTAASLTPDLCQRTIISARLVDSVSSSNKHSLKTPSKSARLRSLDAAPKAAPRAVVERCSRCLAHPGSPLKEQVFTRTTVEDLRLRKRVRGPRLQRRVLIHQARVLRQNRLRRSRSQNRLRRSRSQNRLRLSRSQNRLRLSRSRPRLLLTRTASGRAS